MCGLDLLVTSWLLQPSCREAMALRIEHSDACLLEGLANPPKGDLCKTLISDPRRECYMGLHTFIFLSGPYLWNRYLQRLQIECAAWSCGLIVHCCLPSNSLHYFILFYFFFTPRFCPGHISGTVTRRDSKLRVLLGPAV